MKAYSPTVCCVFAVGSFLYVGYHSVATLLRALGYPLAKWSFAFHGKGQLESVLRIDYSQVELELAGELPTNPDGPVLAGSCVVLCDVIDSGGNLSFPAAFLVRTNAVVCRLLSPPWPIGP